MKENERHSRHRNYKAGCIILFDKVHVVFWAIPDSNYTLMPSFTFSISLSFMQILVRFCWLLIWILTDVFLDLLKLSNLGESEASSAIVLCKFQPSDIHNFLNSCPLWYQPAFHHWKRTDESSKILGNWRSEVVTYGRQRYIRCECIFLKIVRHCLGLDSIDSHFVVQL